LVSSKLPAPGESFETLAGRAPCCEIDESAVVSKPLFRKVDAVTVRVPNLDAGIAFYVDRLGHPLRWRNDDIGAAAVALPESDTEIVLTTQHGYEPNWLVDSADDAAAFTEAAGGRVVTLPSTYRSVASRWSLTRSTTCWC